MVIDFETVKPQNVEVRQKIHYKFKLFLEVRRCNWQNISRNSTAPITHCNRPDKNCDSHLSLYKFMWASQTCSFQKRLQPRWRTLSKLTSVYTQLMMMATCLFASISSPVNTPNLVNLRKLNTQFWPKLKFKIFFRHSEADYY